MFLNPVPIQSFRLILSSKFPKLISGLIEWGPNSALSSDSTESRNFRPYIRRYIHKTCLLFRYRSWISAFLSSTYKYSIRNMSFVEWVRKSEVILITRYVLKTINPDMVSGKSVENFMRVTIFFFNFAIQNSSSFNNKFGLFGWYTHRCSKNY